MEASSNREFVADDTLEYRQHAVAESLGQVMTALEGGAKKPLDFLSISDRVRAPSWIFHMENTRNKTAGSTRRKGRVAAD